MKRVHRVMLLLVMFIVLAFGIVWNREPFEVVAANEHIPQVNDGTQPWNRHPVVSVPFLQMRPAFQRGIRHHTQAAYFEMDNQSFEVALQKTFAYACTTRSGPWSAMVTPSVSTVPKNVVATYPDLLKWLETKLNASPFFGKAQPKIQIVHDRWIGFQKHTTNPNQYLLSLETILYRQGKFQGKHVSFSIMVEALSKRVYTVTQTRVEGVVAEDKIGLFPVVAIEGVAVSGHDYLSVPNDPLIPYPKQLIDAKTIDVVVRDQRNKLNRSVASQLFL